VIEFSSLTVGGARISLLGIAGGFSTTAISSSGTPAETESGVSLGSISDPSKSSSLQMPMVTYF